MFNVSAHIWLYSLPSNTFLQYIVWTSFPLVLVTFSVGFTYLVSPHAIGKSLSTLSYMSVSQPVSQLVSHSVSQLANQSASLPVSQPVSQPGRQSVSQSVSQPASQ